MGAGGMAKAVQFREVALHSESAAAVPHRYKERGQA